MEYTYSNHWHFNIQVTWLRIKQTNGGSSNVLWFSCLFNFQMWQIVFLSKKKILKSGAIYQEPLRRPHFKAPLSS